LLPLKGDTAVGGEPRALSAPAPPEELTALLAPEVEGAALNSAPSKSSAATPCCWGPCTCPAGGVAADAPSPTVDDEAGPLLPPPPAPNKSSVLSTRLGTIGAPLMTSRAPPKPSRSSILPKETLPGRLLFFIGEEEKGFTGEEYIAGEEKKSLAGGAPGVAMGIAPEVGRMGVVAALDPRPKPKMSSNPPPPLPPVLWLRAGPTEEDTPTPGPLLPLGDDLSPLPFIPASAAPDAAPPWLDDVIPCPSPPGIPAPPRVDRMAFMLDPFFIDPLPSLSDQPSMKLSSPSPLILATFLALVGL